MGRGSAKGIWTKSGNNGGENFSEINIFSRPQILFIMWKYPTKYFYLLLALLDQRSIWDYVIVLYLSPVTASIICKLHFHISIFFTDSTGSNKAKLVRNVHWIILYKVCVIFQSEIHSSNQRPQVAKRDVFYFCMWTNFDDYYTPRNEVVGGVYWFHHVRPSVRPSVCRQILCRMITWVVFLRIF